MNSDPVTVVSQSLQVTHGTHGLFFLKQNHTDQHWKIQKAILFQSAIQNEIVEWLQEARAIRFPKVVNQSRVENDCMH